MINKKTVFILGAGASCDFKYPLGEELRWNIIDNLLHREDRREEIAKAFCPKESQDPLIIKSCVDGYNKKLLDFGKDLRNDGDFSIDAFLERFQKKYLEMGKMAIAQIIAQAEYHERLLFETHNWYRLLYKKMKENATIDTFSQNQVSFITFNYDRSLEHFLYTSLKSFHENITESKVCEIMKKIPIIHLYGKLDPLPWEDSNNGRKHGDPYTLEQFRSYLEKLSIIFEEYGKKIQAIFEEAFKLMEEAERLYIIGFGFAKENSSRLKINQLSSKQIEATAQGFDLNNVDTIFNSIGEKSGASWKESKGNAVSCKTKKNSTIKLHFKDACTFIDNIDLS
jgi:hypothetical protein